MKTITNIIYLAFAPFAFAYFALAPQARAVCQEGCDLVNANTFLGDNALINNTTGTSNTAVGEGTLYYNTYGYQNTAMGAFALGSNTAGTGNTATGVLALYSNTTCSYNTATGFTALLNNIGCNNTAFGSGALEQNTYGFGNTATGESALFANMTGSYNTATGEAALGGSLTGNLNTACGFAALGYTTGSDNIALGYAAGSNLTTGNNNIDIGNAGVQGESRTIRIGTSRHQTNTYIAGISGVTVATGVAVIVDSSGHLGTTTSSERFKEAIQPMDKASEAILALKPVTFRYKKEIDADRTPQFGLIAEDVAKVNPALAVRDEQGKPYTVRYEAVNAMLLNEFLKEHRTVQELKKKVAELTAGLQKVSAQLEVSKPATQTVLNNQ